MYMSTPSRPSLAVQGQTEWQVVVPLHQIYANEDEQGQKHKLQWVPVSLHPLHVGRD